MPEIEKKSATYVAEPGLAAGAATLTSDLVVESAPGFAIASLMISSAQAQSRALEAAAVHQAHAFQVGLATSTQCVVKIFDEPSRLQSMLSEVIAANKV